MTNNTRDDTARDGLVVQKWIDGGCSSWGVPLQSIEALLARIETLEAQHAEDVKRNKAGVRDAYYEGWRDGYRRGDAGAAFYSASDDWPDSDAALNKGPKQ